MIVDIIDSYKEFEKHRPNWDAVYESDPDAQFFLSWTWLSQVFSKYESGWFICAVKSNENYVAYFPLRLKTRTSNSLKEFYNEISVAGRYFWADYSGFICDPHHDETAIPCLAEKLKEMHWRELNLKNLFISERRLDLLLGNFDKNIFSHTFLTRVGKKDNINRLVSPYIDLPDDFESYLNNKLSAKTRQKARRYLRKFENDEDLKITISTPETYERDIGILIKLWKEKWKESKGNKIGTLAQKLKVILQKASEGNTLYMPVLWKEDKPLGVLGCFLDQQKKSLLYFVAGRDETDNTYPSGVILHAHTIRWAIANGFKTYDFLRGDEQFKYSYGAVDRNILYLRISTKSGTNLNHTLDPKCIEEVLKITAEFKKTGKLKEAEAGYQQILEADPKHAETLGLYGHFLYQQDRFVRARKIYLKLIETDARNSSSWHGLGKSLLGLKIYEGAEIALRQSLELNTIKTISTRYYLGRALQGSNLKTKASKEYSAILGLKPNDDHELKKMANARKFIKECKAS